MDFDIRKAEFWDYVWKKARRRSSSKKGAAGYQEYPVDRWNKRAAGYAKQTSGETRTRRWFSVKEFFSKCNLEITPGMKILDIGSGPGTFAIPFAEMGAQVWALDPAERMIEILEEEASKRKLTSINTFTEKWEDVNLESRGWLKNFDLVFASMSPGINSLDTIKKMLDASKSYCYISSFAGPRKYPLQETIARGILGEDYKTYTPDIIYPFNIVYSMGYLPNVLFEENYSEREVDLEDVYHEIITHIAMYTQITPEVQAAVENYLQKNKNTENKVVKKTKSRIGMLLWQV
ncbi:MAG: methyltransferase domain-containing protein [Clostridia bacterium]|nr:methyltransferase domain-containing protein [Clostridia bacterium]